MPTGLEFPDCRIEATRQERFDYRWNSVELSTCFSVSTM